MLGGRILGIQPGDTTHHQIALDFSSDEADKKFQYAELYDEGADGAIKITEANGDVYTTRAQTPYTALAEGPWSMQIDESVGAKRASLASTIGGIAYPVISGDMPNLFAAGNLGFGVESLRITVDFIAVISSE